MDRIIHLHSDPHLETEKLLPWYVTGQLDPADHAAVEAHLSACAACREELRLERRLSAEVATLPLDAAPGWSELRGRLGFSPTQLELAGKPRLAFWRKIVPSVNTGGFLAAQVALILIAVAMVMPRDTSAPFHALGAPPVQVTGNIIVIFRPDAREQDMRKMLNASAARLIDGPTAANAYVLHVPAARRNSVLTRLRAQPEIVLAQPIDADPPS